MAALIPSVGYARRSTDKQEASIPEQQKQVEQYAADKGYKILRWYVDDAVSGDDTANRHQFLKMLSDAQGRGDFKAILCWDQDRFGRFSPHEASYRTYPLAQAGVQLVTVTLGPINWGDFTEWLLFSVKQHGKHEFLKDLSRNVTRGQLEAMNNGGWVGTPPYGYRTEGPRKAKRLVVDDPRHARVVRRIYQEYALEGRSLHDVANRLNADRVPTPRGHIPGGEIQDRRGRRVVARWRYDTVRVILANPAYCGDYAAGKYAYGKYHSIRNGRVEKSAGKVRHPQQEWIVRRDYHEAIIDRETWQRAQDILARGKTGRSPYRPDDNPYVFAGVLRCGRCGNQMWGGVGGRKYRTYECGHREHNGAGACEGTTVRESDVLLGLADFLDGWLGDGGQIDWLEAGASAGGLQPTDLPGAFDSVRRLFARPPVPKPDLDRLAQRVQQLRAARDKARANLVVLDPENIPAAQDRIRELNEELAETERQLEAGAPRNEDDLNRTVAVVIDKLWQLAYSCRVLARPGCTDAAGRHGFYSGVRNGKQMMTFGTLVGQAPKAVKNLVNHLGHIVCHTHKTGAGKRTRHTFTRGEIVLAGDQVVTGKFRVRLPVCEHSGIV